MNIEVIMICLVTLYFIGCFVYGMAYIIITKQTNTIDVLATLVLGGGAILVTCLFGIAATKVFL